MLKDVCCLSRSMHEVPYCPTVEYPMPLQSSFLLFLLKTLPLKSEWIFSLVTVIFIFKTLGKHQFLNSACLVENATWIWHGCESNASWKVSVASRWRLITIIIVDKIFYKVMQLNLKWVSWDTKNIHHWITTTLWPIKTKCNWVTTALWPIKTKCNYALYILKSKIFFS